MKKEKQDLPKLEVLGPREIDERREAAELEIALAGFALMMKERLMEKLREGHRGWQYEWPSHSLRVEIMSDIQEALLDGNDSHMADIANRAMFLWYRDQCRRADVRVERPRIVTLCGSTRFWQQFRDEGLRLTMEGKIVLSIGIHAPESMKHANPDSKEGKALKIRLDALHKQKINISDEIFVLNVGGYIGESTKSEIRHAVAVGKRISWLEPDKAVSP